MKSTIKYFSILFLCMLLGACAPKEDPAELYEQESPLQADITMPDDFSDSGDLIKIELTQNSKIVEDADFVHVEIWKGDGSFHDGMEEAENAGDGIYTFNKNLKEDGLYYIKVHAGNNGSTIMPTLPFAVGELSKADVEALNDHVPVENGDHSQHH
ncbi:FixH family protein [Rossellomorea sp. SC111]|uniref:FixH family protein n=1 Tax=Rossellomorea sp. SC111 TaxID=2968985 RepID=UPI00215ACE20|nr:FixH family protein [Rossellomorea sp. SC111]MCR8849385.1 FixH family protein [Rossellomorea sp. SC111]